jgi:hypothetical protein
MNYQTCSSRRGHVLHDLNENGRGGAILDKAEQSILQKQRTVARCDNDSDKVRHCS